MSEYDFIINQTLNNHADDMDIDGLIDEVIDWMDSENIEYCRDIIVMLMPQCLKQYRKLQKESIPSIGT